jgi:hypothetical protein
VSTGLQLRWLRLHRLSNNQRAFVLSEVVSREAGLSARVPSERLCMKPIRIIIVIGINYTNSRILSRYKSKPGHITRK